MRTASQASFLAIICHRTKPPPATADAEFIAVNEITTERYLCKGQKRSRTLPASEWICAHLARACFLPAPPFAIVELASQPGVQYFGSQWLGGALDFTQAFARVSNPEVFGNTLAADMFVHNIDRHLNNYLYLELAGEVVARVIDFSRAWLYNGWPLPRLPLPPNCNTLLAVPRWMAQYSGQYKKPTAVLDVMAALPDEWMRDTLEGMPEAWLSRDEQLRLREWWIGRAQRTRIDSAESLLP